MSAHGRLKASPWRLGIDRFGAASDYASRTMLSITIFNIARQTSLNALGCDNFLSWPNWMVRNGGGLDAIPSEMTARCVIDTYLIDVAPMREFVAFSQKFLVAVPAAAGFARHLDGNPGARRINKCPQR